jgi:hypothetical protein
MWRRPVVTILMLIIAVILPLPLRAQQKPFTQEQVSNMVRAGLGDDSGAKLIDQSGIDFAPSEDFYHVLSVAASLPRHGGVKPPLRYAAFQDGATTPGGTNPGIAGSPAKPFTQEQVVSMVRDGFGDESGAKLIEQRGIDFAPSEDFYQTLKAAGASEAFLNALRAAVAPTLSSAHADLKVSATTAASEPASVKKPLNQVQVFALLVGQVPSHRVTMLVQERGIDFEPTDDYLQEVRLAGGEDELISALKSARMEPTSQPIAWRSSKPSNSGRVLHSNREAEAVSGRTDLTTIC